MTAFKLLLGFPLLMTLPAFAGGGDPCETTAALQLKSASFELREELLVNLAACKNIEDDEERAECLAEARTDFLDGLELMQAQYDARVSLCGLLGGGIYDPEIEQANFVSVIDNPYLPFPVGAQWNYESDTEDGFEEIQVTVLSETREIMGVECVAVQDTVTIDGVLLEDTTDWYAQDVDGNVWYFGEISFNYDDEGYVEDIEGSWIGGVDGAKPGIVMLASPDIGHTYRQEWLLGEAEDAGTVLDDNASVTIGIGTFSGCVQTEDFTPVDPEAFENKFYFPGIGFIYETKIGEPEVVELVSYSGI